MTRHGVCTYLLDPDRHIHVGDVWASDIKTLHPDLCVRVPIRADANNHLDLAEYVAALAPYQRAGIDGYALIDQDFNRPWLEPTPRHIYPNETLGYQGNRRQNKWIKDTCVRAGKAAKVLKAAGITRWIIGNECNLQGHIPLGANVPPVQSDKGPATSPEAFYSFGYECAGYLRAGGAEEVVLGSLSWLPTAGDDDLNPFCGGYMKTGLQYAHDTGVRHWPLDALSVNCEGVWPLAKALGMKAEIDHIQGLFGLHLPIHVGEWGWPNGDSVDAAKAVQTFHNLTTVADLMLFFQHPCREPNNRRGYALRVWTADGGVFAPIGDPCDWYPIYKGCLESA